MVYKNNIPQLNDFISQSQVDMVGNFESINRSWGLPNTEDENIGDHISLDNPNVANYGKHKKVTFVEQESAPSTGVNEIGLYTKDNSGRPEIFYRRESDGAESQLTDRGNITVGGMVLGAWVMFDFNAKVIEKITKDENNKKIKVPYKYNISSVTVNQQNIGGTFRNVADYTITFETAMPDNNYCWVVGNYTRITLDGAAEGNILVSAQAANNVTYANSVQTTSLRIQLKDYAIADNARQGVDRIAVQVYRIV